MSVTPIRRAPAWRQKLGGPDCHGPVEGFLAGFETHLEARPASPATIYRYLLAARQLDAYLGFPDVGTITRGDVEKFIVHTLETAAPTTANGRYMALVQFFKFVKLDLDPIPYRSPMLGMAPPQFEVPQVAVIPADLLAALVRSADRERSFEGVRDAAILRLFVDTGARLAEITGLRLGDLEGDVIRLVGKSKGKGPVVRRVRIGRKSAAALRRYLRDREHHPAAETTDRLWLGRGGRGTSSAMTTSGIRQIIWRRSKAAGLRIHPHQFRHTFAHGWKAAPDRHDGDLMEIMGWRDERSMHRYGRSAAASRALEAQRRHGAPGDKL